MILTIYYAGRPFLIRESLLRAWLQLRATGAQSAELQAAEAQWRAVKIAHLN